MEFGDICRISRDTSCGNLLPWFSDSRFDFQQGSSDPGLYGTDRHAPGLRKLLTAFAVNIGSDNQIAPRRIKRLQGG